MQCFYVLVHGQLRWLEDTSEQAGDVTQPIGFFCHRYVFASNEQAAINKASASVIQNLDRQTGWLKNRIAELKIEAEEVTTASFLRGFLPHNRGHTFYDEE